MNCPHCGALVPEGSLYCPACRYEVGSTQRIPKAAGNWCPSCGALVADGASFCGKCGRPLRDKAAPRPKRNISLPEIEVEERPRHKASIESALPPEGGSDSGASSIDRLPRPRILLLAAVLAFVVVGGAVVLITHPWDPMATDYRAREDADLSMVGYPGERDTLSGQDSTRLGTESADTTFELLSGLHARLGELSDRADACEEAFFALSLTGTEGERSLAVEELSALSYDLSNTISEIGQVSGANGAYAEDVDNLVTLGNWLRNRVDALVRAWELVGAYQDPAAVRDIVQGPVTAPEYQTWSTLFEENYDVWSPVERN